MKMSIDEAENYLIALKHCETCEANDTNICKACPHYKRGSSAKCYDAIDVGVDTMRKYQKIEEIVENRNSKPPLTTLNRIIKVVENGNDD